MKILITNDDGVFSPGIRALADALCGEHDVTVVAPEKNASAVSHKVNIREPFRAERVQDDPFPVYAVEGSPADCVGFALGAIGFKPDVVLSGVNDGMNIGSDVMYSGTVAAAMEAGFLGVSAFALSVFSPPGQSASDFAFPARYVKENLARWLSGMEQGEIWNINIPAAPVKGEAFCPLATLSYTVEYTRDGSGKFRHRGYPTDFHKAREGSDLFFACAGYVTITPLTCDFTDYKALRRIKP